MKNIFLSCLALTGILWFTNPAMGAKVCYVHICDVEYKECITNCTGEFGANEKCAQNCGFSKTNCEDDCPPPLKQLKKSPQSSLKK